MCLAYKKRLPRGSACKNTKQGLWLRLAKNCEMSMRDLPPVAILSARDRVGLKDTVRFRGKQSLPTRQSAAASKAKVERAQPPTRATAIWLEHMGSDAQCLEGHSFTERAGTCP
jgi:hypothetical protein